MFTQNAVLMLTIRPRDARTPPPPPPPPSQVRLRQGLYWQEPESRLGLSGRLLLEPFVLIPKEGFPSPDFGTKAQSSVARMFFAETGA